MAPPQSQKQRSRTGCLPCRKRRKKCDEQLPVCARCARIVGSQCCWLLPSQQVLGLYLTLSEPGSADLSHVEAITTSPDPCDSIQLAHSQSYLTATGEFHSDIGSSAQRAHSTYYGAQGLSFLESVASNSYRAYRSSDDKHIIGAEELSDLAKDVSVSINKWDYARSYGPTVTWIPHNTGLDNDFDPDDAMPLIRQSIAMLGDTKEPVFVEVENFYLAFFARYYYDYASITDLVIFRARERFATSDCLKQGMLSTAVLFRANYENSGLTAPLRDHARELHSLAVKTLQVDLDNHMVSPWVKLSGVMELVNHEYYAGNLATYYHRLSQAASLARMVLHGNTMDLLNVTGEHTFDIRLFAWCDIMGAMALSRPTLLDYESELPNPSDHSIVEEHHAHPDKGVEWIFGCPDVLAVLLARTTKLMHASISLEEKVTRGREIERLVHSQFGMVRAKTSLMRVARLAAQELWRHAAILYIHHAIFKSDHGHAVIQNSVKQIIKLAATLKAGVNPDCFLSVPYFIAGFFATSPKHRHILRSRVLSCGNERFLRHLAEALDELWKKSDTSGGLTSWAGDHPPKFIF
ncbi:putative fungal Zn(2)-cys(6) binuclear cluster domain protein [Rhizoctonia solani 123E]|uniref:Putative fungal Zn(2)-cys(6) binuclear cluster domain protein n=1 Tax=Rhizoctonia solani 123E TaxID=1423351 RepID=A0A074SIG8_9AGAM|nr:putative fungal Zn(2)-cys(6) binuclear cluster domain protein [Rhizoctonia solani 123E]